MSKDSVTARAGEERKKKALLWWSLQTTGVETNLSFRVLTLGTRQHLSQIIKATVRYSAIAEAGLDMSLTCTGAIGVGGWGQNSYSESQQQVQVVGANNVVYSLGCQLFYTLHISNHTLK